MTVKAQAAMEFLMTYGWAILVVLVVVGALAYFGVLNPSNLVPERCVVPAPLNCKAAMTGSDGLQVALQNTANKDMTVTSISFTSDALAGTCASTELTAPIPVGQQATIFVNGCLFSKNGKQKYQTTIKYTWNDAASIQNQLTGELVSNKGTEAITGGVGAYGSSDASLVGYWHFEENGGLADASGNGNDGSMAGSDNATNVTGIIGEALEFGGNNDFVTVSNSGSLQVFGNVSFTFWARVNGDGTSAGTHGIITKRIWHNDPQGYQVYLYPNSDQISYSFGNNTGYEGYSSEPSTIDYGAWYHYAVVQNATHVAFYKDGSLISSNKTVSSSFGSDSTPLYLGTGYGTFHSFNGTLDEVAIYNRALTPAEVAIIASQ